MLNVEKYKSEIAELLNTKCTGADECEHCPFDKLCSQMVSVDQIEKWLFEECQEPIKLTKVQYEILKSLKKKGFSSCAISNGKLLAYEGNIDALYSILGIEVIDESSQESQLIKDILENCVVK